METFTRLCAKLGPELKVRHVVREDLLDTARRDGGVTEHLAHLVQDSMEDAASNGAGVVVCTCSTIGGAAEKRVAEGKFIPMRIDRPMADHAVKQGRRISNYSRASKYGWPHTLLDRRFRSQRQCIRADYRTISRRGVGALC